MDEALFPHLPSFKVDVCVESIFRGLAGSHLIEHELDEVGLAVVNHLFYDLLRVFFTGPGRLPGGPIAISASAAGSNLVAQSPPSVGEVSVPTERR